MMRFSSPIRSHDGTPFHRGRSPDGSNDRLLCGGALCCGHPCGLRRGDVLEKMSGKLSGAM
jgi:hypothetical protein